MILEEFVCPAIDTTVPVLTAANFPALRLAITEDSVTSSAVLTDVVTGRVFTASSGTYTANGDGTFSTSGATSGGSDTPLPGISNTHDVLLIYMGDWESADQVAFGTGSGPSKIVIQNDSGYQAIKTSVITDNLINAMPTAPGGADLTNCVMVLNLRRSLGTGKYYSMDDTRGYEDAECTVTGSVSGTWDDFATDYTITGAVNPLVVKAIYVLYFETALSDDFIERATRWMYANQGNLYPGFKGLT